jgi:hypothetical protein
MTILMVYSLKFVNTDKEKGLHGMKDGIASGSLEKSGNKKVRAGQILSACQNLTESN